MITNKVICLEGPDGSGKTTLANFLKSEYGFQVWHEGVPPPERDQLQYYGEILLKALSAKKPVVFDRLHIGENVYGPIMRNSDRLGYFGLRLINRICSAHGVPIIVCLPPYEVVLESWKKKFAAGDDYVRSEKKIWDVYYRYKALSAYHTTYDYTSSGNEAYCRLLMKTLEMVALPFPLNSLGRRYAKFLIVGERPGGELDCCFFSDKNSSGFINQALWDAGYHEREMFFINAFNARGEMNDLFITAASLPDLKAIIALGKAATDKCRWWNLSDQGNELNLPIHELAHPQYVKRFKKSLRSEYVKKLAEIRGHYV